MYPFVVSVCVWTEQSADVDMEGEKAMSGGLWAMVLWIVFYLGVEGKDRWIVFRVVQKWSE